jgi:hypothetical protein
VKDPDSDSAFVSHYLDDICGDFIGVFRGDGVNYSGRRDDSGDRRVGGGCSTRYRERGGFSHHLPEGEKRLKTQINTKV